MGLESDTACIRFYVDSLCKVLLSVPKVPNSQLSFIGLINLVAEIQFCLLKFPTLNLRLEVFNLSYLFGLPKASIILQ